MRRRAWAGVGLGVCVKAATLILLLRRPPGTPPAALLLATNVFADLVTAVSLIIALNTSPRAERRFFGIAARLWEGRFGSWFFRLAAVGRGSRGRGSRASGPDAAGLPASGTLAGEHAAGAPEDGAAEHTAPGMLLDRRDALWGAAADA